ncbi:hypothetical protein FNSP4_18170 [Fusobacterium nucleatum]|uniref:hypothetical protein n=1 Tax=Fusobacterium nucleatum subsp. polymorphum TaxID=76857 RepID=UPI00291F47B4|nr:hypothetical protein FNCP4_12200 [Fusobacterium nucleatum]BEP04083.1 hypothetical protein FNSP4_18170 [Fusobacterium nucleatum]
MTRGGKREGAGRKKLTEENKTVLKSFRIKEILLIEIKKNYPALTLSSIIEKALIEYIKKNKKE